MRLVSKWCQNREIFYFSFDSTFVFKAILYFTINRMRCKAKYS
nr:MAG TPA: hypothetical protein [Caudoviricetes sp.]